MNETDCGQQTKMHNIVNFFYKNLLSIGYFGHFGSSSVKEEWKCEYKHQIEQRSTTGSDDYYYCYY